MRFTYRSHFRPLREKAKHAAIAATPAAAAADAILSGAPSITSETTPAGLSGELGLTRAPPSLGSGRMLFMPVVAEELRHPARSQLMP